MSTDSSPPYGKQPRTVGPRTKFATSLGVAAMFLFFAGKALWLVRDYLEESRQADVALRVDIKDLRADMALEVKSLRADLQSYARDAWKFDEQNSFAGRLRWENRSSSLVVPEPRDFRR